MEKNSDLKYKNPQLSGRDISVTPKMYHSLALKKCPMNVHPLSKFIKSFWISYSLTTPGRMENILIVKGFLWVLGLETPKQGV